LAIRANLQGALAMGTIKFKDNPFHFHRGRLLNNS
jgi:hypothetical protein